MRTRNIVLIASAGVVLIAAPVVLVERRGPDVHVTTSSATTGTVARQVLATGTLEAANSVEVGSQVSGTIASLPADFNSIVRVGEVVARLDPAVYKSQLEAARGQLEQARAEAAQAQTTLDDTNRKLARAEELSAQELITKAELDAARIAMQQAAADLRGRQAAIQIAQAGVKQSQVDLDRTVVRSPINGVVVNRNVDVGQTIAASLQSPVLFTIADLRQMHLLTEVNEGEIGTVRQGSGVTFQVESMGPQTFHGTVADVRLQPYAEQVATGTSAPLSTSSTSSATTATTSGSATTATTTASTSTASGSSSSTTTAPGAVTYTAVIDVPNTDGLLSPGGTAIVTLSGGSKQGVVRIPNNALTFRPTPAMLERTGQKKLAEEGASAPSGERKAGAAQVWRFENKQFVPLEVVTGLSDDQWTEMISGNVQPGDQLVTSAAAPK